MYDDIIHSASFFPFYVHSHGLFLLSHDGNKNFKNHYVEWEGMVCIQPSFILLFQCSSYINVQIISLLLSLKINRMSIIGEFSHRQRNLLERNIVVSHPHEYITICNTVTSLRNMHNTLSVFLSNFVFWFFHHYSCMT